MDKENNSEKEKEVKQPMRLKNKISFSIWNILLFVIAIIILVANIALNISHITLSDESIVLSFVGILATFVVVGNFAQTKSIKDDLKKENKKFQKDIKETEKKNKKLERVRKADFWLLYTIINDNLKLNIKIKNLETIKESYKKLRDNRLMEIVNIYLDRYKNELLKEKTDKKQ